MKIKILATLCIVIWTSATLVVQTRKTYTDAQGKKIEFPLGDLSFADEVVSHQTGNPRPEDKFADPKFALGPPNYQSEAQDERAPSSLSLGCGGTLVVRFVDNVLVDVKGPDLHIFEVGPAVEGTALSISTDGKNWIDVGKISGGTADVDISPAAKAGETFHYARLTDLKSNCTGRFAGADIDAVGAIGSAVQFSLNSAVLFEFDKATLKPEAQKELDQVAAKIRSYAGANVVIEGHTDSVGSDDYNQRLSESRAQAVRQYFVAAPGFKAFTFESRGHGESRPIAPNETEEGREKNRRVEITVAPSRK
jgi:OmpA-OmpF porin, OOP family